MSERLIYICDQCGREGDEFTIDIHVERRLAAFSERSEADLCSHDCLSQWALDQIKAAAK
jgi:hypothetical protein